MKREEKIIALTDYFQKHTVISTTTLTSMNIQYKVIQELIQDGVLVKEARGCYKKGECLHVENTDEREENNKFEHLEDYLQKNLLITTATLKSMNITPYYIQKLLEKEVLVKVSRGHYQKGRNLLLNKNTSDKTEQKEWTLEEFEQLLLDGNYQLAANTSISLEGLMQHEKNLLNTYLLLLVEISKIEEDKEMYIQGLQLKNIKIEGELLSSINNKIRLSIWNKKFSLAYKQLVEKYNGEAQIERSDKIFMNLLRENIKVFQKKRTLEIEMQKNGQYLELQNLLLEGKTRGTLSTNEHTLLHLVQLICKNDPIEYSNKVCYSVYEGIECQNYKLALEWDEKYASENHLCENQRLLTIALKKVNEIIELQTKYKNANYVTVSQILETVWEGDLVTSITLLNQYLEFRDKLDYFEILKELLQLDIIENSQFYKTFYEALLQIDSGIYDYSMTPYLLAFAHTVDEDPEKAEIYLNILKSGQKIGVECSFIPQLSQKIESIKQKYIKFPL